MMKAQHFSGEIRQKVALDYLLYLPPDYDNQPAWPLILFLHGRGERGSDLEQVKLYGLPRRIANGDHFPFVIVAPQCPAGSYWTEEVEALNALLDHVVAELNIDTSRIYLTGMSMGGRGTWFLAGRYPERFAAIAPICGPGLSWVAQERLGKLPVWIFHGEDDPVAPIAEARAMVHHLNEAGGNVRFTFYPGVGHDSWTQTYDDPELYDWFLSHHRP